MTLSWLPKWNSRRGLAVSLLVGLCCVVLATLAQWRLDAKELDSPALLAYAVAGTLLAMTFGGIALERTWDSAANRQAKAERLGQSVRVVAVLLGVALIGCLDFGGNRFGPFGILLWGGGVALCMLYLYLSEGPSALATRLSAFRSGEPVRVSRMGLGLLLAMLVGGLLRLCQLETIPADIGWDLPYNYTDGLSILGGEYRIFFPANQGREGMFFYLIALVARFSPLSHFSIKLTSALVGTATIPALFLLGRRLFNSSVGLVAAAFLAVNRWHIVLSRSGFRVSLLPLFVILTLFAVARALQSHRPFDFGLAGLAMGLGVHTYTAFTFSVLAVFAALALWACSTDRSQWRSLWTLVALTAVVALVVYAPLLRFALERPDQYLQRVSLQRRLLTGDPSRQEMTLPILLENVRTSLLMYHVNGDHNVRFNVPFYRHFGLVSGVLLVLGLFYTVRRWRQGSNSLLLVMFFTMIAPMTLAMFPHEMPNIFRAAGTIGPALLLTAVPLLAVAQRAREFALTFRTFDVSARFGVHVANDRREFIWRFGRRGLLLLVPALLIIGVLAVECRETCQFYFHDFVHVLPDRQNVSIAKEMARQMEAYGDLSACFIKVWPHWFDGRALQTYLRQQYGVTWRPEFGDLSPNSPPLSSMAERALIILHPDDTEGQDRLKELFPLHATVVHYLPDEVPAFVSMYVER